MKYIVNNTFKTSFSTTLLKNNNFFLKQKEYTDLNFMGTKCNYVNYYIPYANYYYISVEYNHSISAFLNNATPNFRDIFVS